MKKQAHILIYGDVTDVGFRAWMLQNARKLGIVGWVQNKSDGIVEAEFVGDKKIVEEMIALCKKGPEVSWVKRVEVEFKEVEQGDFHSFEIRK